MSGVSEQEFRRAVLASAMSTARKLVAIVFAGYAHPVTGESSHPKQATVARDASLGVRKVRDHVKALESAGWLVVTGRLAKGVKVYRLAVPADADTATGEAADTDTGRGRDAHGEWGPVGPGADPFGPDDRAAYPDPFATGGDVLTAEQEAEFAAWLARQEAAPDDAARPSVGPAAGPVVTDEPPF